MPCRQIFSAKLPTASNATIYGSPTFGYTWSSSAIVGVPWQTAGSFKNVSITHASAPGSGKSFTYTFVKNGADTALVVTIADLATTGSNTADAVAVVPGDVVYWKRTTSGTPPSVVQQVSGEFWGDVANESAYGNYGAISNTATWRNTVFNQGLWNTSTIAGGNFELVAAAGDLTAVQVTLATAPTAGKSYAITLYKNAVKQDGAGGTVNTTITIADSATTGSWTGTLALVAGDYVTFEAVPTGTPALASGEMACGVKFVATTDGESQGGLNAKAVNIPTIASTYYTVPHSYAQSTTYAWNATESGIQTLIPPGDGVTVRGLRVRLSNTVQTGPITFTLRQNGADTALTATLTSTQTTGSDPTNSVTLAAGDAWSVEYTNPGSPGSGRTAAVNFVVYALIEDACVFLTTTRTERAVFSDRAAIGTLTLPTTSVLSLGELPERAAGELVLSVDATGEVTAGALASADLPAGAVALHATTHSTGQPDAVTVTNLAGYPGGATTFLRADATFAAPTATPSAHATSHQPGGADAMAVDAAAATGSLRTLGTSATSAAAGNDSRLTNARTPTAHATTHKSGGTDLIKLDELAAPTDITTLNASTSAHGLLAKLPGTTTTYLRGDGTFVVPSAAAPAAHATSHNTGGADPLTALSGAIITTGTVADARLSSNVALEDVANTFTQPQSFTSASAAPAAVDINSSTPSFALHQSTGTANQRRFHFGLSGDVCSLDPKTDSGGGTGVNALWVTRLGDVKAGADLYEKGRSVAIGHWQAITFNAANFTSDPGTWTVGSGAILQNRYALVGKTMFWSIYVSWFSGSNTITGAPTILYVQHPSVTFVGPTYGVVAYGIDAGAGVDLVAYPDGGGWIGFIKKNGAAFTAGTATGFVSMMTWEIA